MVKVDLKGIAKVTARGRTYWYAWRGGPRLRGEPGSPEFIASYSTAIEERRTPDKNRLKSVVVLYKASDDFQTLADSTKRNWATWLDRISDYFGDLRIAQFDRSEKIRPVIRRWRSQWAHKPRTADYGVQVLSRMLSLAIHTGLGLSDLLRLSWSHIGADAIVMATGKSKHRCEAIIPLYDDLRAVLAAIPRRSTTILTNSRHRPWKVSGFGTAFNRAKIAAGMSDRDLHFHDLRGTAATRFYTAGLSERVIAEIMGWEEEYVAKIIRRYVSRTAATKAAIAQLNRAER
jgi:integrase